MTDIFSSPAHLKAKIFHGRSGRVKNSFRYNADYVAFPLRTEMTELPTGLSRNGLNLWSINDKDFGDGATPLNDYADRLIKKCNLPEDDAAQIALIAMPRSVFYSFNPIAFWLFCDSRSRLKAVVVEVSNVSRDRHSYLCRKSDGSEIKSLDEIRVSKALYVSPFQGLTGEYAFQFDLSKEQFDVTIKHFNPVGDGLVATLSGDFKPVTTRAILASSILRPFGALRVMALIFWQALRLRIKGAQYLKRPRPPEQELSI